MKRMTAVKFYDSVTGKWIGVEFFSHGFHTSEVVDRCNVHAEVRGHGVFAKRPDGFVCGMSDTKAEVS